MIDAHHHVWDLTVRDQQWIAGHMAAIRRSFTMDDLRRVATPCGVVGSVLVQCVADPGETSELLRLGAEDPMIAGVVGFVDLTAADVGERLDRLREQPGGELLSGIRHVIEAEPDPDWLVRPDVINGLREVASRRLAFDLLIRRDQFASATTAVEAIPDGTFVLDHLGKPAIGTGELAEWARSLRRLASHPNVVAKLSGLVTEANWSDWTVADLRPYVEQALDAFGPQRLMFGSDWPVCLLAAGYADVVAAIELLVRGLDATERSAIFHENAASTYRLSIGAGHHAR